MCANVALGHYRRRLFFLCSTRIGTVAMRATRPFRTWDYRDLVPNANASCHLRSWLGASSASIESKCRNGRPDYGHLKQQQKRPHPAAVFKRLFPVQRLVNAQERHLLQQMPQEEIEQIRKACLRLGKLCL